MVNRESERKRLVEVLSEAEDKVQTILKVKFSLALAEWLGIYADHLLDNGVVVPPCKVGDVVWRISENGQYVYDTDVSIVFCDKDGVYFETIQTDVFVEDDIGKTVFLTREEAEAKLKGGEDK